MSVPFHSEVDSPPDSPLEMTWEEFLDWCDEDTHADWVDGKVIMHSPVSRRHTKYGFWLLQLFGAFLERVPLGEIAYNPFQIKIAPDSSARAPDIMFIAQENLDRIKPNMLEGPADLIVEIVSPESRGRDRGDKFYEYEAGGVREYLLLDPERQRLEWYALGDDGVYALITPDDTSALRSAVLPGFFLRPDWLWQDALPTVTQILQAWQLS